MDTSYLTRNRGERERMRALIARLSGAELARPLGQGWTVSAVLAHLAFWDRETLAALRELERSGTLTWPLDWDAVNAEHLAEWLARPPHEAAEEAITAAEAVDQKIAGLAPEVAQAILAAGRPRLLDRSIHRREHLDEVERVVGRKPVIASQRSGAEATEGNTPSPSVDPAPVPTGQQSPGRIDRQRVSSGSPYEPTIGFSRALRVGDRVLVSGTAPIWPDGSCDPDPTVQAHRCLEIILAALREAGASAEHVVRTRTYLRSVEDAEAVARAHGEVFHAVRPASTMIVVAGFLDPRWKVEIEAEAVVDVVA